MTFVPTPHRRAIAVWREDAKWAKTRAEREYCENRAKQCEALAQYEEEHANDEPSDEAPVKQFICECGRDCNSAAGLKSHMRKCEVAKMVEAELKGEAK